MTEVEVAQRGFVLYYEPMIQDVEEEMRAFVVFLDA